MSPTKQQADFEQVCRKIHGIWSRKQLSCNHCSVQQKSSTYFSVKNTNKTITNKTLPNTKKQTRQTNLAGAPGEKLRSTVVCFARVIVVSWFSQDNTLIEDNDAADKDDDTIGDVVGCCWRSCAVCCVAGAWSMISKGESVRGTTTKWKLMDGVSCASSKVQVALSVTFCSQKQKCFTKKMVVDNNAKQQVLFVCFCVCVHW